MNAILQEIDKCAVGEEVLSSPALEININDFERIIKLDVYGKRFARYLMLKLGALSFFSRGKRMAGLWKMNGSMLRYMR